jgi:hypothetical protein
VKVYLGTIERLTGWSLDTTTAFVAFSTTPLRGAVTGVPAPFSRGMDWDTRQKTLSGS